MTAQVSSLIKLRMLTVGGVGSGGSGFGRA